MLHGIGGVNRQLIEFLLTARWADNPRVIPLVCTEGTDERTLGAVFFRAQDTGLRLSPALRALRISVGLLILSDAIRQRSGVGLQERTGEEQSVFFNGGCDPIAVEQTAPPWKARIANRKRSE